MDNEKLVVLTPDEKAVLLKSIKDLQFGATSLSEWIKTNVLTEGMKRTLPSLIESYFIEIAEQLDYQSALTEEHKQRHVDIRKANERISELEQQLAYQTDIDGLPEAMTRVYRTVSDWWNEYGFNHVSDFQYTEYGYIKCNFSFMLSMRSSRLFSKKPVTDREDFANYIEHLKNQGYELIKEDGYDWKVLDTPNNRDLLVRLLKSRFPSIHISKFDSQSLGKTEKFYIWQIEAYIYELKDVVSIEVNK